MNESYALLVGINKYRDPGNDLAGCVNDCMDWLNTLRNVMMPDANIKALLDKDATQANVIAGLNALMAHKSKKHRLVVIMDCCHAESNTRDLKKKPRSIKYPFEIVEDLPLRRFGIKQESLTKPIASPRQKHVLIAACKDHQTASDTAFNGRPNGAFTWALMRAMQKCGHTARTHDLFMRSKLLLKNNEFSQVPVIEGPESQREKPLLADRTLYFIYSGHGAQVPDINGDETDKLDEVICPYDFDWNNPLSDDVLREILCS